MPFAVRSANDQTLLFATIRSKFESDPINVKDSKVLRGLNLCDSHTIYKLLNSARH